MRHAGRDALFELADVLEGLAAIPQLRATRPGAFSFKGKAFCHFHEDDDGYFVDVRLDPSSGFTRLEVTTPAQRRRFLAAARPVGGGARGGLTER